MSAPGAVGNAVVGIDATPSSPLVAHRAAELARAMQAKLVLVLAFEVPSATPLAYCVEAISPARVRRAARGQLEAFLESMDPDDRTLVDSAEALLGPAGPTLVSRADDASLLVVGSRGQHGALRGALTGSVADYCVRHASCSVLVVRPDHRAAPSDDPRHAPVAGVR